MSKIMYKDAVRDALIEEMNRDPSIFLLGEDIGVYGGAFRVTEKMMDMFPGRVLDTPISEEAITGVCIGAAIAGKRPVGEMMYEDWIGLTLDQFVNQASCCTTYTMGRSLYPWSCVCRAAPVPALLRSTPRAWKLGIHIFPA